MEIRFDGDGGNVSVPHVFVWKQRPWQELFASCW